MNWTKAIPVQEGDYFIKLDGSIPFTVELWVTDGSVTYLLPGDVEEYPISERMNFLGPYTAEDLIK